MAVKNKTKQSLQQQEQPRLLAEQAGEINIPKARELKFYKNLFIAAGAIILVVAAGFFAWQNHKLNSSLAGLQKTGDSQVAPGSAADTNKELVGAVGKLLVLPADEQPTIATVADLDKLKDQPFFVNAQVGDKVLIYATAKKAILYRPSENKILELAPLNIGEGSAAASQKMTVEIRNGSGKSGAATLFKNSLAAYSTLRVVAVGNASKTYDQSMVLLLNPLAHSGIVAISNLLPKYIQAAALPVGEKVSSADIVVIIGKQ